MQQQRVWCLSVRRARLSCWACCACKLKDLGSCRSPQIIRAFGGAPIEITSLEARKVGADESAHGSEKKWAVVPMALQGSTAKQLLRNNQCQRLEPAAGWRVLPFGICGSMQRNFASFLVNHTHNQCIPYEWLIKRCARIGFVGNNERVRGYCHKKIFDFLMKIKRLCRGVLCG